VRTVEIVVRITVRRPHPTAGEAREDRAMEAQLQAILDDDMQDRARRLEAVLNAGGAKRGAEL
jgi:hypothetical protein